MSNRLVSLLSALLAPFRYVAIFCGQWGDSGKGKITDFIASLWARVVLRRTGSANAGHTVVHNGNETVLHQIPSGILHPHVQNIIDEGVAFDAYQAWDHEIKSLIASGVSCTNLSISNRAKLLLPQHIVMDMIQESDRGELKIGTTNRGVGPCYTDFTDRIGLIVDDMQNKDRFVKKLERNLRNKVRLLSHIDPEIVKKALRDERLRSGLYLRDGYTGGTDRFGPFEFDTIVEEYCRFGRELQSFICDTRNLILHFMAKEERIAFEGAQGTLLSVDYGTYPNVTSSDASFHGLTHGILLDPRLTLSLMVMKFPYMTRVGNGSFPTELRNAQSDAYYRDPRHTKETELRDFPFATVNSVDPHEQAVGIRQVGKEYGRSTGRPRRIGWFDIPLARYAVMINGTTTVVTTLSDVLDDCETIRLCTSYRYHGPDYRIGERTLKNGHRITMGIPDDYVLQHSEPEYVDFPGWLENTSDRSCFEELPQRFKDILLFAEREAGFKAQLCSFGPDRMQTIVRS